MALKSEARLLCEDYCKQHPKLKTLTLAKKIFEENKKDFPELRSIDCTRGIIRVIRGSRGKMLREKTTDKSLYQPLTHDTTNSKPYQEEIKAAKILILDIETAPGVGYIWDVWKQNISADQVESDWFCLTWAAKWLFEKEIYSMRLTGKEALKQDDKRIMKGVWKMLNEADIVVAHNGDKFDIPRLNTRFLIHGMHPPLPYISIDTLTHIRKQFAFFHNKLDYVNSRLGLRRKEETGGFQLWKQSMQGDEAALKKMDKYNVGDILALEDDYLKIRPWIRPHPNIGLYILDKVSRCPSCGSGKIKMEGKYYYTSVNRFEAFRCDNCGAIGRVRNSDIKITERRFLTTSVPK